MFFLKFENLMNSVLILFSMMVGSCAGPTSPFGPLKSHRPEILVEDSHSSTKSDVLPGRPQLWFYPAKQNLHSTKELHITLKDPKGFSKKSSLEVFYNGKNISDRFQKESSSDSVKLLYPRLSLPARTQHQIVVRYQQSQNKKAFYYTYPEPDCDLRKNAHILRFTPFSKKAGPLLEKISTYSSDYDLNSSLMAALIAQESGFNPKALSWAKAIGLTQITPLAEGHVLQKNSSWPRYKNLNSMNVASIRAKIYVGLIHESNEWRLNPTLSILGGLTYMDYLKSYWGRTKNANLLEFNEFHHADLTNVILASYNSGPYRIKKALRHYGASWKSANHLGEARSYIRKIKSFCHSFSAKRKNTSSAQYVSGVRL